MSHDNDHDHDNGDDDDDDDQFLNCFSDKDKLIQGKSSKGSKCILPSFILNIINIINIINIVIIININIIFNNIIILDIFDIFYISN